MRRGKVQSGRNGSGAQVARSSRSVAASTIAANANVPLQAAPTQAERVICIDEAFGGDTQAVRHAVARWDAALCGVVHVTSRVVDPLTEPCSLTVLRVDPSWQWVQSRPRDALAWTDTDRGIAWVLTPAHDLESVAAHEIGHLDRKSVV